MIGDDDDEGADPFGLAKPAAAAAKPASTVTAAPAPTSAPVPAAKPAAKKSIFDDDSDEGDSLFSKPAPKSAATTSAAPASAKTAAKASSLFDADSDDDGLFGSKPKPATAPAASTAPASAAVSAVAPTATTAPAAAGTIPPNPNARRSVFDDDDDDDGEDLFAAKKPAPAPAPAPASTATATAAPQQDEDVPPPPPKRDLPIPLPPTRRPAEESDSDGDGSGDDLFGGSKKAAPAAAPAPASVNADKTSVTDESAAKTPEAAPAAGHVGVRMGVALPMPFKRPPVEEDSSESDNDSPMPAKPSAASAPVPTPAPAVTVSAPEPELEEEPKSPLPQVASPTATANKRLSGGLASIMAGMDPSKIMMPGMAPPKFSKPAVSEEEAHSSAAEAQGESTRSDAAPALNPDGTLASAAISRATTKQKRAPTKKSFTANGDSALDSAAPLAAKPAVSKSDLFGDDSSDLFGSKPAAVSVASSASSAQAPVAAKPAATSSKAGLFGDEDGYWVAGALRYVAVLHFTWLVNSAAHVYGDHPYDPSIWSAENPWVSLVAMGEGWHNWHHKYPFDYAASEFGVDQQFNPTKLFIDVCAYLGLASELKRATGAWSKLKILREEEIYQNGKPAPTMEAKKVM
jgi:hypothetical protein